jgi:hypothetical protein
VIGPFLLASTVWLCRPGLPNDPCTASRTATVIVSGKAAGVKTTPRSEDAGKFDCFYVYPTVNPETTHNADLALNKEERGVATDEASRFSEACNVWAPVYRQITTVTQNQHDYDTPAFGDVAYASILSAWKEYRARYNHGRPIVFIGHSQGVQMLVRLLRQEIEPDAALRRQLVLAILVGGNVAVASVPGSKGSFANIPACRVRGQTGCVIGYSLFNAVPPDDSRFGIPGQGASLQGLQFARTGVQIICTNPAALSGGSGLLDTYLRTTRSADEMSVSDTVSKPLATPWVEYRNLFSAECRHQDNKTWLHVTSNGTANGYPRLFIESPKFGLHNYDMMLPLGNLVDDVKAAEETYLR